MTVMPEAALMPARVELSRFTAPMAALILTSFFAAICAIEYTPSTATAPDEPLMSIEAFVIEPDKLTPFTVPVVAFVVPSMVSLFVTPVVFISLIVPPSEMPSL